MVTARSDGQRYRTQLMSEGHTCMADASGDKGGDDAGFGPHVLLEAAVASCINIWLRMIADKRAIPLGEVEVEVRLNRQKPGEAVFEYVYQLHGGLTCAQREELGRAIEWCPVSQTLQRAISFQQVSGWG